MRTVLHWTPRYVVDRIESALYERANPDAPWLTPAAVEALHAWLWPSDKGFEWGSGRSTMWLASRVASLTSVESDPNWFARIQPQLAGNVRYLLRDGGAYVGAIKDVQAGSLDFVLVDGQSRDECALAAMPKLRGGGLLIIDNADRYLPRAHPSRAPNARGIAHGPATPLWGKVGAELTSWRCVWTTNGVTDTAFWIRP